MSKWSQERIDLLTTLWMEGKSGTTIARILGEGFTENSVIGRVYRMGLCRPERTAVTRVTTRNLTIGRGERAVATRATTEARARALNPSKPEPAPMRTKPVLLTGQEKVWTERKARECNWVVAGEGADSISCCSSVHKRGWCEFHFKLGTEPKTLPTNTMPAPRKRAA